MAKPDLLFKRRDFQTIFNFHCNQIPEFIGFSLKIERSRKNLKTSFKDFGV